MKKKPVFFAMMVWACVLWGGTPTRAGQDPVRIGLVIPMTGAASAIGHYLLWGVEYARDEVNAQGGVLGAPVEIVLRDDETNPEKALQSAKELVEKEKVSAVLGPANSGNALAMAPYLQQRHVPQMILTASATTLTTLYDAQEKNYVFRATLPDVEQLKFLAGWAARRFTRLGVAFDSTPYGRLGKEDLVEALGALGLQPAATTEFEPGEVNLERQARLLKEANVEAAAIISLGPEIASFVRSADMVGLRAQFFGLYPFFLPSVAELPERLSNGLTGVLGSSPQDSAKAAAIDASVRKKHLPKGYYPFRFVVAAYEGAKLLFQAVNEAGGREGEAIRDALENVRRFEGAARTFEEPFSGKDHELYERENLYLGTWRDGAVVRVPEENANHGQ